MKNSFAKLGFCFSLLMMIIGITVMGCSGLLTPPGGGGEESRVTGSIGGKVNDKTTGKSIGGANIKTDPITTDTETDSDGRYVIANVDPGIYTLTVSKDGYKSGTANVSVEVGEETIADIKLAPGVTSVSVEPTSVSIGLESTATLTATVTYGNNTTDNDVDWFSSDESVARVSSSSAAVVTGMASGSTTITATANKDTTKSATAAITVVAPTLASIEVVPDPVTIVLGNTQQFTAVGKDADGIVISVTPVWSVTGGIGSITTDGLFSAMTTGNSTVVATSGSKSDSASVTVTLGPVSSTNSTVMASPTSVNANGTNTSTVTVALKDVNNNPLSGHSVTISSGTHITTITPSSLTTDSLGQAVFSVRSTQVGTVTITATDSSESVVIANTASITFNSFVIALAAGGDHTIALKSDGTVWTWGWNIYGQLGNGTTTDNPIPVQVSGLTDVSAIAGAASHGHTIALKSDGTVWAWGFNQYGQLGNGATTYSQTTPVQVSGLTDINSIEAGLWYTVSLKGDGTVWAWGYNNYGQLGDGASGNNRTTPVQVCDSGGIAPCSTFLSGVIAVDGGGIHLIALKSDATVWTWGSNVQGQLGASVSETCSIFFKPCSTTPIQVNGLTGVSAIAGGRSHTLALNSDGTVWTWGYNGFGQLGNGTTTNSSIPVQVSGLTEVSAIASGGDHTIALKSDGTVWTWGANFNGQLGDGTTTSSTTPVQVNGLTGVSAIAGGREHTLALKNDGTVWTWGGNWSGKLGDGTTVDKTTPVQVQVLTPSPTPESTPDDDSSTAT